MDCIDCLRAYPLVSFICRKLARTCSRHAQAATFGSIRPWPLGLAPSQQRPIWRSTSRSSLLVCTACYFSLLHNVVPFYRVGVLSQLIFDGILPCSFATVGRDEMIHHALRALNACCADDEVSARNTQLTGLCFTSDTMVVMVTAMQ